MLGCIVSQAEKDPSPHGEGQMINEDKKTEAGEGDRQGGAGQAGRAALWEQVVWGTPLWRAGKEPSWLREQVQEP